MSIQATNDMGVEMAARGADPRLDRAMNAFWRSYHTEGPELWRCVAAAVEAACHDR